MKKILLVIAFLVQWSLLVAQVTFTNPGFEGPPLTATCPPFWISCDQYNPDTNPNDTSSSELKIYIPAFAGHTYVGIGSSKLSNVQKSVGQKLSCNLVQGKTHRFSLHAYHISYPLYQNGYLEFWGGSKLCSKQQLLWQASILDTFWTKYQVSFVSDSNYDYVLFTDFPCDTCQQVYIGLDSLSEITVDDYNLLSLPFSDTTITKNNCINLNANSDDTTGHFVWSSIPSGFNANGSEVSVCPIANTKYICTITSGCGMQKSDTVNVEVIPNGVANVHEVEYLSIYPNPAQEELIIDVSNSITPQQITIIDALGRAVLSITSQKPTTQVNISILSTGIYFIKTQLSNGNVQVNKFVKQ